MEQLPNFLNQRAFLTPNRLALVFDNQRWSFMEMYRTVETLAQKNCNSRYTGKGLRCYSAN